MFAETQQFRDKSFQPIRSGLPCKPPFTDPRVEAEAEAEHWLDGNPSLDRPLFVQFCANKPEELLDAAQYVAPFCDAVDLNLGCPQGIARKGAYGAFLQEDHELIYGLVNKLHKELHVPVTAKIRILETKEKTLEYAKKVLSAGASILTVHGRQRDQKGHKTGLADWSVLRYLRGNLPKETVLFANGNILRREDIDRCLEVTGVDAVMSAEGNLYDPAIFADAPKLGEERREYWRGRDGRGGWRMDAVMRRYLDIIWRHAMGKEPPRRQPLFIPSDLEHTPTPERIPQADEGNDGPRRKRQKVNPDSVPEPVTNGDADAVQNGTKAQPKKKHNSKSTRREKTTNPNLIAMQPHLFHLLRSLVSKHHNVRDALARCKAGDVDAFEGVLALVEQVTREGLIEYEKTGGRSVEEDFKHDERFVAVVEDEGKGDADGEAQDTANFDSSVKAVRECKRPWWVCQSYVRLLPKEALEKGSLTLSKKEREALRMAEREKEIEEKKDQGEMVVDPMVDPIEVQGTVESEMLPVEGETVEIPRNGLVCG
jgi:tRNA-dihydrouridine synthase 1